MAYGIEFSPHARNHIKQLRKRDQTIIFDAIAKQLSHEPDLPTRQRKRLEDNSLAPWELRVGDYRIFYDIDSADEVVVIVAVGRKSHNRLYIGDEEVDL